MELKTEDLEKTTAAMAQLKSEVDALKKNQITEEGYLAKGKELVEVVLKEHETKAAAEAAKKAIFPTGNFNGDPRSVALKSAFAIREPEDKAAAISQAFLLPTENKALEALPAAHDELVIVSAAMAAKTRGRFNLENLKSYKRFTELRDAAFKYMDTTDTSTWVPTNESAMLLEVPDLTGNVENLFEHITMPTKAYDSPVLLNGPTTIGTLVSENTAHVDPTTDPGAQALTDGKFSFSAKKMMGRMVTSGELNEDSIVAIVPTIKRELARITARSVETAIINGDATGLGGTHMDYDVDQLGDTDPRVAWDGLRHAGMTTGLLVALTTWALATLRSMRGKLGAYGVNPLDLAWIFTIKDYLRYIVTNDDVRTQNVYGPRATVFTGQLEQLDGSPIIVSPHMPVNLHTTGYNTTGQANTAGACILVSRPWFKVGDRRLFTIEADRLINTDQFVFVSFRRLDFQPHQTPSATYSSVSCGYNIVA